MCYLSLDEILELHRLVLAESGGMAGIRDHGALESAMSGGDIAGMQKAAERLQQALQQAGAAMYQAGAAGPTAETSPDGDSSTNGNPDEDVGALGHCVSLS